jgi:preprotein translocase subunit SecG
MGLFHFLIVVQGIVAAALVGIILMQRSEGGGLGTGGSPSGLMSARGAADFMTRTTTILATLFIILSISLAFVAAKKSGGSTVDQTLERTKVVAPAAPEPTQTAPNPAAPGEVPLDK